MSELKLVSLDNAHLEIPKYITENNLTIETYENMMDVVLSMIRDRYFFNMDKNILRGCLEDLTYMYSSEDDVNKDRVVAMLEPSDDEDEDDEEDDENLSMQQDFQKMMLEQMKKMSEAAQTTADSLKVTEETINDAVNIVSDEATKTTEESEKSQDTDPTPENTGAE